MKKYLKSLLPLVFAVSLTSTAFASMLSAPTGPVLLTVSGSITETNDGDVAKFDRAMLETLDWKTIEAHTRWTDGAASFSGASLSAVLDAVGATGKNLIAIALNDYAVEIPVSDALEYNVLLAMEINGEPMKIRDKGPIWIIYPQTEEEANEPRFDEKMIWQLKSIKIGD